MTNTRSHRTIKTITAALLLSAAAALTLNTGLAHADTEPVAQAHTAATPACWVEHKADGTNEILSGDPALMPAGSEPFGCGIYVIGPDDVSDRMWQSLLEAGYVGDPTDGAERLYVPLEVAVAHCRTDADCENAYDALTADAQYQS